MKKILLSLSIISLMGLQSCSREYLDVNENPNQAYNDQLTPRERLAAAETGIFATQAVTVNRFGNLMMNAWAGNTYYFASPFDDEFKFNLSSTFYDGIWDNYYRGIGNFQRIIDTPNAATAYPNHVAIARVLKTYYMQTIVDLYGNAPYTDAFKFQANVTPKYDSDKSIYKALLVDINTAINQLKLNSGTTLVANEDPILAGNLSGWLQVAYTVKLRLLVRMSKTTDAEMIALRDAELATMSTLSTANYITTDVTINPGYGTGSTAQQNPLYNAYGYLDLSSQDIKQNYRLIMASDHIIKDMSGQSARTSGVVDSRRGRMFYPNVWSAIYGNAPTTSGFFGIQQGSVKDYTRLEEDFAGLGQKNFVVSLATGSAQPGIFFSAAESKFLQSEAAVVFPSLSALSAQTRFNEGVAASFAYNGVAIGSYLTLIDSKPGVGWTASTDKVAAIQYQRWIALTNINPVETYFGYSKTGYPVTPLPLNNNSTRRPYRLIYPQSEYVANSANVPTMSKNDAFVINGFTPFWMK